LYGVLDDEKYNKILVVYVYTHVPCFVWAKSSMYLLYYPEKINAWRIVLVLMNFPDNFEYHQVMFTGNRYKSQRTKTKADQLPFGLVRSFHCSSFGRHNPRPPVLPNQEAPGVLAADSPSLHARSYNFNGAPAIQESDENGPAADDVRFQI
jgi:hypothetical protein